MKTLGREVIVVHPRELKWITSSDSKNDPVDACKLAVLLHRLWRTGEAYEPFPKMV